MSFLAALAILLHALFAGAFGPTPAPHGVMVAPAAPAPATVAPAPARAEAPRGHAHPRPALPSPPVPAAPTVSGPSPVEPAPQGPAEVIGRQIDCPDGSVGTVTDVAGDVSCPGTVGGAP